MGLLIQRVAEVSGYSPEQGLYDVAYPTGFLNFDHLNGYNLNTFNDKGELVDLVLVNPHLQFKLVQILFLNLKMQK